MEFAAFGTYFVHSGLLSLAWEKLEERYGYLVCTAVYFANSKQRILYVSISIFKVILCYPCTTPPNFRVCAWQKVPAKCFKICHILYIRKHKVDFSIFHFVLLYYPPNECQGLCQHKLGHSFGGKTTLGFCIPI